MTATLDRGTSSRVTTDPAEVGTGPAAVAIGMFDGVHRGHRRLIAECRRRADRSGLACGVVTFADHPATLLAPERAPALLSTPAERIALVAGCGVDFVLVLPLTGQLLRTTAEDFVSELLVRDLAARAVVVGSNFRFGHRASGDPAALSAFGRPHGLEAVALELVDDGGLPVSSTRIRGEIAAGRVRAATALLGRPHPLAVTVTATGPHGLVGTTGRRAAVPAPGTYRGVLTGADGRRTWPSIVVGAAGTVFVPTDPAAAVGELVRVDLLAEIDDPGGPAPVGTTRP